jgi:chemotaxis protein MotA
MAGASKKRSSGSSKLDLATLAGLVVAFGCIGLGMTLEGGKLQEVASATAALIVLGGTVGAVMITTPINVLTRAAKRFFSIFLGRHESPAATVDEIIELATEARRSGIVSLEDRASQIEDPFLKKALNLAVDGIDSAQIRDIMDLEIHLLEEDIEIEAKVFESAGGYAPTIGIIGAVIGLIQVMQHLADIEQVGRGIAAAFVATIYGVASANILFLPAASKLKARGKELIRIRELMLEGVISIAEGVNQKLIRVKLEAYLGEQRSAKKARDKRQPAGEPVSAEG